jgi:hypothetical protein
VYDREKINKLESTILVNSEANAILRSQMDEIHENMYMVTREELERYQSVEGKMAALQTDNEEANRQKEYQLELLHRGDSERVLLQSKSDQQSTMIESQVTEIRRLNALVATDKTVVEAIRREKEKAEQRCEELIEQVQELQNIPVAKDKEVRNDVMINKPPDTYPTK